MGIILKDSPKKSHGFRFWMLLLVLSILLGTTAALLPLAFPNTLEIDSFELPKLLQRIILFSCAFLIAFYLLVLIFKIFRRFFCWLFSWRTIKRGLFALAFLVLLTALFYAEEDWRGKWDLENYQHKLEAKGEKYDFKSFVPPPVPDDQNFALTPIVAGCYSFLLDKSGHRIEPESTNVVDRLEITIFHNYDCNNEPTNSGWERGQITDLKKWQAYYRSPSPVYLDRYSATNEFEIAPQPQSPAADVLLALSKYGSVIEELRRASHLPYSRFPLNYDEDNEYGILLPHVAALKRCAQVLRLRAIAELNEGQTEKALADVKLMFHLSDSVRNEPSLISHLVRIVILENTLQPVWEGLAEHKWSDIQIAEIEQELGGLDFLADHQFAMRGERAGVNKTIDYLRRHRNHSELVTMFFLTSGYFVGENEFVTKVNKVNIATYYLMGQGGCYLMPSGWYYQNELTVDQIYQQWFLQIIDAKQQLASPNIENQARAFWLNWQITPQNIFAHLFCLNASSSAERFAYGQSEVNLARTGCALERYHLARGDYPEKLDALVPEFIDKLPHDIIGGQPLKYHRTDDGQFVLYSVGWNETDDGGVVCLATNGYGAYGSGLDNRKGDWVWRYPPK